MSRATATTASAAAAREEDQRIFMRGVTWSEYEALLAIRGERAGIRIAYLKGDLELMTPSIDHESIKTRIARLLECCAEERGIDLNGYGSWTIKSAPRARGAEPDECYIVGVDRKPAPDLAIEVVWAHGGLDKLEIYRGLRVREVWVWREGEIEVHALRGDAYERVPRSELVPDLDLVMLTGFLDRPSQTQAVREFRAALRQG
ncbi:MAG TPA: Uma2 family endonuclease [Kofleriaceae bacterium]|nr:Uma2 family endonuclease [Kofleriaceae bacterium]